LLLLMTEDNSPKLRAGSVPVDGTRLDTHEPVRWTDPDSGAPPELVAALRAGRSQYGSDARVRALRERLGLEFAAPRVSGSPLAKLLPFKLRTRVRSR
jgi:hypothetical protein